MKIINVDIKKKTIQAAYSQVMLLNKLDFYQHQKGEPLYDLVMEIKRSIKRNNKLTKLGWRELLDFWPLSIVTPTFLILIIMANIFQW